MMPRPANRRLGGCESPAGWRRRRHSLRADGALLAGIDPTSYLD